MEKRWETRYPYPSNRFSLVVFVPPLRRFLFRAGRSHDCGRRLYRKRRGYAQQYRRGRDGSGRQIVSVDVVSQDETPGITGFDNIVSQARKTSNGSGFFLAKDVGGYFFNMDKLTTFYGGGVMTDGFEMTYGANTNYPNRVYVDKSGNRVGDETTNDVHMWMDAPEDKLYIIVSQDTIDPESFLLKYGITYIQLPNNGWDKLDELALEGKVAFKADTIEELAEKMGAGNLVATMAKYNADAKSGNGDTVFGRSQDTMTALENGPFIALETVPYAYTGSTGGVMVSGDAQLLLEDGTVVENLYLAGEILGPTCVTGKYIFGGINHSMAVTWALNCVEHAAAAVGK